LILRQKGGNETKHGGDSPIVQKVAQSTAGTKARDEAGKAAELFNHWPPHDKESPWPKKARGFASSPHLRAHHKKVRVSNASKLR
jgi:hypothetical protein